MAGYPSRAQFFAFGLPAHAFVSQPRIVVAADPASDVLTVPSHGLSSGDLVRAAVNPGGSGQAGGVLPAGLSATTLYAAFGIDTLGTDMLQLAIPNAGMAVDFTDAGSPVFSLLLDLGAKIDLGLDALSRHADQFLKGHATPLTTAPLHLIRWICHLLAYEMSVSSGLVDPSYAKDPALSARAAEAQKQLDKLQRDGETLAGVVVDATPGVEDNASVAWGDADRCWSPGGIV